MRISEAICWQLLGGSGHGVLSTVHATRGVDAVPVVYLITQGELAIPVDTVKEKGPGRLQRLRNLDRDGRCVLLVEHYEEDWSMLWWVRIHGQGSEAPHRLEQLRPSFQGHFGGKYDVKHALSSLIIIRPTEIFGWAASRQAFT